MENRTLNAQNLFWTSNALAAIGSLLVAVASFIPFLSLDGHSYTMERLLKMGNLAVNMSPARSMYIIAYLVFIGAFMIFKLVNGNNCFLIACVACAGSVILMVFWLYILIRMNTGTGYSEVTFNYGFSFLIGGLIINILALILEYQSMKVSEEQTGKRIQKT